MAKDDFLGPPVHDVSVDDVAQLAAMFAEQRARVAVVREQAIWHWFGGVPSGFGSPNAALRGVQLQLAFVALAALALVVAGLTRGPWLWATVALAAACLVARELVTAWPERRTLRFYRRALLVPAIVVARSQGEPADPRCAAVLALVRPEPPTPAAFAALLQAAARLRHLLDGTESVPAVLERVVARVRAGAAGGDGGREPAPELDAGVELARLTVPLAMLPDERLSSRLLFVLLDPGVRAARHTRVAQPMLWGPGGEALYRALREEATA